MDSDCLVPPDYFAIVQRHIDGGGTDVNGGGEDTGKALGSEEGIRFYGGADSAAPDFSPLQKAVSYSMTSLFTTGGIRGSTKSLEKFTPRSFNLGIEKELFMSVGGFADMRIGEDIDFSLRVAAAGAKPVFLPDATVCHKRRTSMRLFFKQVFIFGTARVNLNIRHPRSRKAVFYLPMLFTLGSAALMVCAAVFALTPWRVYAPWFLAPLGLLMLLWFTASAVRNRSLRIGWLSIWTSFTQLYGYGLGFLYGLWMRRVKRLPEKDTYKVTRFFSQKTR
jgi:GT2 family glycosyltransferase